MLELDLSLAELEKAFTTLKSNKGENLDEINFNIVRQVFDIKYLKKNILLTLKSTIELSIST